MRALRFRGVPVEVQNYIDDTGVQVADVVVGFRQLENKDLAAVRAIADSTRFDFYCWDLYARVADWYEADKTRLQFRLDTLHDIEHGGNEAAEIGAFIADRIVRCHLVTMARMNVDYDLLAWEGDILRLHFWARAFEILKEKGAVFLQTQGRLAGCWVMPIEDDTRAAARAPTATPADEDEAPREGHRPLQRHRDLRRQGHGLPVVEVRPARQGLPLPGVRQSADGPPDLGDLRAAEPATRRRTRRSAARARSSTSSTSASRTCRSC